MNKPFYGFLVIALFWIVVSVVLVFACGCEDVRTIDIQDYIDEHCIGGTEYIFDVDSKFDGETMAVIADSIEHFNSVMVGNLQICAAIDSRGEWQDGFIQYASSEELPARVGYYSGLDIFLYTDGPIYSNAHLRKVLLHEIGHYFGVGHSDSGADVMCQGWWGVSHYSENDISAISEAIK